MEMLPCHSDATVSATAALEGGPTTAVPAAETAVDSAPSGTTELDQPEVSLLGRSPNSERRASTWGNSGSGSEQQAPTTADSESPEAYNYESVTANETHREERLLLVERQHVKAEGSFGERAVAYAVCCKEQPKNGTAGSSAWLQDPCSSKEQQQESPQDEHAEEASEEGPQGPSAVAPAGLEGRSGDAALAKISGTTRGSSGNGSGSGSGVPPATAVARVRGSAGSTATASEALATTSSRKCIDEGSVRRHVVPVGPRHQVPCLPPFFLESETFGCGCRESSPGLDPSLTAKLVYSPSSLERVRQRRLAEGLADRAICSEGDMEAFMQQCAKNWKGNKPGWQPFSPEFAFKLLHYAGYDPARALQLMEDPQFPFQLVCDGPVRRYDNKWRPKDRRGVISPTPYPPPVFLRGYLSRRHYRESSGYSLR
ncbi:uncharacterized protein LOC34617466 [Cyclospora cayetanensis]|nr:uncharacterized protein LOC34617466 [Cyclospora cayetanensis]